MEGALGILREQGLRVSSARRLVLQSLFAADGPASAEAIASRTDLALDLASVYRNLETLERVGIVQHVHLGHGPGLYALAGRASASTSCAIAAAGSRPSRPTASSARATRSAPTSATRRASRTSRSSASARIALAPASPRSDRP